ncbi:MAG: hypothetical protein ABI193_14640 [Minicystis sp.]
MLAALALCATPQVDLRILAIVVIPGPFTPLRPVVVVAATARGVMLGGARRCSR